ncbi:MAG: ATP-binding protein [Candidatus Omnitrophota bacterium]|nr:MAG: ATP-binding protein [Candidatus Omnitrophota bacterium]
MITREAQKTLTNLANKYSIIMLTGPRQSGKTTLCKQTFKEKPYVLLENFDQRDYAINDPRGFLSQFPNGAILDEVQKAPKLISYLQGIIDTSPKRKGLFILTGSQNLLLLNRVTQSLAGRTAILNLLPFSFNEISRFTKSISLEDSLFKGFFPRIYDEDLPPTEALSFYFKTYVERDIRDLLNIKDIIRFQNFVRLCAARVGQVLNLSSLGNETGISHQTARDWFSLLEASFIIFRLSPYYRNFNKRVTKSPKLYFYDIGLVSYLLEIKNKQHLKFHPLKGNLFENMIISELVKYRWNRAQEHNLYFFRDSNGNEVDVITQTAKGLTAIEIKSGQTIIPNFFKGLDYFERICKDTISGKYVVYGGKIEQKRSQGYVLNFKHCSHIFKQQD